MNPLRVYCVTGSIEMDDITAYVILDKKNNSIHLHFYGGIFGNTKKRILVKHSGSKFPENDGVELAKQIVIGEFPDKKVQIKNVTPENGATVGQTQPAQRTIIRFNQ